MRPKQQADGQVTLFKSHDVSECEATYARLINEMRELCPVMCLDVADPSAQILRQRAQCVIAAYHTKTGRVSCRCCGEDDWQVLVVDHVNGDGKQDRDELKEARGGTSTGAGVTTWRLIVRQRDEYPYELQLLCEKCNHSKGRTRFCKRHQTNIGPRLGSRTGFHATH